MADYTLFINSTVMPHTTYGGNCRRSLTITYPQAYLSTYAMVFGGDRIAVFTTPFTVTVTCTAFVSLRLRDPRTISLVYTPTGLGKMVVTINAETAETSSITVPTIGIQISMALRQPNITSDALFLTDAYHDYRWAVSKYADQIWFCNQLNTLRVTDGATIKRPRNVPAGRYLVWYFDHCFIGWPVWQGAQLSTKLMWSDLHNYWKWIPGKGNEADSFDFVDWCQGDVQIKGLTGLAILRDTLYVFTPTSIIAGKYTGLPKIMQFVPVTEQLGSGLSWGLASTPEALYFWDSNESNFFMFNGAEFKAIGGPVRNYVLATVNQTFALQQATYTIVRPDYQEIEWVFVSTAKTTVSYDKAVVFNYRTGTWYTKDVPAIVSTTVGGRLAGTVSNLSTYTNATLTGIAADLNKHPTDELIPRIYGSVGSVYLYRDAISTDLNSSLTSAPPTLETKDFTDNYQNVLEVDTITLHCSGTFDSVKVYISTRNNLADALTWTLVGDWTNTLAEGRLTFPRVAGKIIRWKFVPYKATGVVKDFSWYGYIDNLYKTMAEK